MRYLVLLNHSKTMLPSRGPAKETQPRFAKEAAVLNRALQSHKSLQELMHISPKLEKTVKQYLKEWKSAGTGMAGWTYAGDIFKGLDASSLDQKQAKQLNDHTLILSGLYGALQPSDEICPYRLEMGARLSGKWGANLYDFWRPKLRIDTITNSPPEFVFACASQEFMKAVTIPHDVHVITPKFVQIDSQSQHKDVTIYTKQARGLFARWCAVYPPTRVADLYDFNLEGYRMISHDEKTIVYGRKSLPPSRQR